MRAYGSAALLVELDSVDEALELRTRLEVPPAPGAFDAITEIMPGLRTVLIRFDPEMTTHGRLAQLVAEIHARPAPRERAATAAGDEFCLPVEYTGPDLDAVARYTGMSIDEIVTAHQARQYRIVLIGMAPGFYFLAGGDPRLRVPRRSSPRTAVPKGAVGLADELTGIYPRTGPGGWQLIGRVVDNLWDPVRLPAALLPVGSSIRFATA